jgi:outer membrane lipoprotein-sorting protein
MATVACLFLLGTCVHVSAAQEKRVVAPLTAAQIVEQLVQKNEQRAQALEGYQAIRVYRLEQNGLSTRSAELVVSLTYRRPGEKTFHVLSESGSEFLHGRVLQRLLQAEVEAMREEIRGQTAISPANYNFHLVGYEPIAGKNSYVLELKPRTKHKLLFRGRIWVDAQDFAVTRMEGEPAKNPSWWTKRNVIVLTYEKVGEFWLPARNETKTQLRIFGRSLLTIVYRDYQILASPSATWCPM